MAGMSNDPVTAVYLRIAYQAGVQAACEGRGRECDPFVNRDRDLHQAWDDGWIAGSEATEAEVWMPIPEGARRQARMASNEEREMSATTEHRSRVCGGWATGHTKVDARSNQEGHVEVTIGVDAIKFRAMLTLTEATALADQLREAVRDV